MNFPAPLRNGRLLRRYKRFLSDIEMPDGAVVVAHCANPGSMLGLAIPGKVAWLSPADNPARKLRYSWELVESDGALVDINTGRTNTLVAEALQECRLDALSGFTAIRREVPYGANSRIDFLLRAQAGDECYLEVKSVTLKRRQKLAEFPDARTVRGVKHLKELAKIAQSGRRAVLLFAVQRADCEAVSVAADIDPVYAEAMKVAMAQGVEVLCYSCKVSPEAVVLDARLPFLP